MISRVSPSLIYFFAFCSLSACATTKRYDFGDLSTVPIENRTSLNVPPELQLFKINDEDVSSVYSYFAPTPNHITLAAGAYRLRLRYRDLWPVGVDDHEVVQSRPLELSFVAEKGQEYELTFTKPNDLKAAEAFAKHPLVEVVESKSKARISTVISTAEPALTPSKELALRPSQPTTSQPPRALSPKQAAEADSESSAPAAQRSTSVEEMKQLWKTASPKERAEFQRWIWETPKQ